MTTVTTLSDGTTTVTLPGDLQWVDEFAWSAIGQEIEYSISGALLIDEATKQAGRPITLGGDWAWIDRATVKQLAALDVAGAALSLTLADGRQFAVTWDRSQSAPIDVTPVSDLQPPDDADYYRIKALRLMTA